MFSNSFNSSELNGFNFFIILLLINLLIIFYFNFRGKFFKKCWRYASVNNQLKEIDPGLSRFMDEYPPHDFIRDPLPLDEKIVRTLLLLIRKIIWKIGKIVALITRN